MNSHQNLHIHVPRNINYLKISVPQYNNQLSTPKLIKSYEQSNQKYSSELLDDSDDEIMTKSDYPKIYDDYFDLFELPIYNIIFLIKTKKLKKTKYYKSLKQFVVNHDNIMEYSNKNDSIHFKYLNLISKSISFYFNNYFVIKNLIKKINNDHLINFVNIINDFNNKHNNNTKYINI